MGERNSSSKNGFKSEDPDDEDVKSPFLIGVAGGTASGKSTVCQRIRIVSRSTEWFSLSRESPFVKNIPSRYETAEHPLKQATATVKMLDRKGAKSAPGLCDSSSNLSLDPLGFVLDGNDPLSHFAEQAQESMDPLSQSQMSEYRPGKHNKGHKLQNKNENISWNSKRLAILNKFTTSEKQLSIVTSFLTGGEMIKTQTTVSDKVKYRLEQLDDFDEGSVRRMMNLTQQEYIFRIEQLNQELVQSWNGDQRVKALKIAIQCSKLLADTSVLQFYPSQFVFITDILDIFGKLVYERLITKAEYLPAGVKVPQSLPDKFTPDMVSESAKETCRNWFYKIASIRELLPRIYVEMAILKCYSFLTQGEFNLALLRLTRMIRGISDPLVAAYARCYLIRVGMGVSNDKEYMKENFNDFLTTYHMIFNGPIRSEINRQRVDMASYLSLYGPSLDWIIHCLVVQCFDSDADEILAKCQEKKNNGPLLMSILTSFKPAFIANRALQLVKILSNSNTDGITKGQLFKALGICLNQSPPSINHRNDVYNQAFATINTLTNPAEYISCVEMWTQFTTEHFTLKEVNRLLGEIINMMNSNRMYENHYPELQSVVLKTVNFADDIEALLTLDNFLPLLDLFQKDSVKFDVSKNIINVYKNKFEGKTSGISDPVVVNALLYICKILNDSVSALTVEDERRQIGSLISYVIQKVDYGRDFEQQLEAYVEARSAFPNLDSVLTTLVHCVNRLAIETRNIVNRQHSRKTSAFVKACAAYCFITIPSIVSIPTQMDLYLLSGQVALLNLCLGQADACFETALNLVAELPRTIELDGKLKSTETYLVSFLCNILSTLLVVPDSPDQEVLYLVRLLLDVLKKYPFDLHSTGPSTVLLHTLDLLYAESLEVFPYHIPNVISNDELYGSDPKFLTETNAFCSQVVDQILIQLKQLGNANQLRQQSTLALELFTRIIRYADLRKDKLFSLANNLWSLTLKNKGSVDQNYVLKVLKMTEDAHRNAFHTEQAKRIDELLVKMRIKM